MPKKLLIIRHGQAESGLLTGQDLLRNLTVKGASDAIAVAEKLLQKDEVPALLVSSNATRALKTARAFAATWNIPPDSIQLEPRIFEAPAAQLTKIVATFNDSYNFIAVFGHNPGFTDLINHYSDAKIFNLEPAGAALIEFGAETWPDTEEGSGKMSLLIEP